MQYILYCRKSTESEDKQVQSLDSQESVLTALAEKHNLHIVRTFRESMSAQATGRPQFNEMISLLQSGKVHGILCWKPDRLARNFVDGGLLMDMLQRGVVQEIRTPDHIHVPSDNVLMLAVEFGMANQYVRDLSANVKRGNKTKLERGEWPNHAPFGYLNDKATKTIVIDEVFAPLIRRAFELYAVGGKSAKEISDQLYAEGYRSKQGKKVFKSVIHKILSSPFYCGIMVRDGVSYHGKHEPIISKDLFDRVQELMNGKRHSKRQKHFFPLRGFMTCAVCGCMLTATIAKGHTYYHCTNGKGNCAERRKHLKEAEAITLFADLFAKLELDEELLGLALRAKQEEKGFTATSLDARKNALQKALKSVSDRQDTLLDAYLAKKVPEAVYEQKMASLSQERTGLEVQLAELDTKTETAESTFEQVKKVFSACVSARKKFLGANPVVQREVIETVLSNIQVGSNKTQGYQFKMPYAVIANRPKPNDISGMLAV